MAHADVLRQAVESMVQAASPFRQAMVAAVGTTTVDLDWGAGLIEDVPCASSYAGRAVGDKVWVIRSPAGNWEVLARSESEDPTPL